jgi:2-polyprenyl-3-methyl-5-hydroxy-6-metoxy-1,4-benzoquinol methylase
MIEISECPVCKGNTFQHITECKDYTVSHKMFHVKQCISCSLAVTSPRPETNKLGEYYKSEDYISHSGKSSGGIGWVYRIARSFALTWKKNLIAEYKKGETILDFGCGTGEFISTLKKNGWKVLGVEPDTHAREKASKLTQQSISQNLSQLKEIKLDVITAWHVLEHVPDINETLLQLKNRLNKDGIIFIAVPNYQAKDSLIYKEFWAGYDVPRHLWHFSKKSMSHLLDSQGFTLLKVVPMKLDAYYICLLSEKYKKNNQLTLLSSLKAFANGFISNLKARINTNHSSLIYIAKIHEE